MGKIENDEQRKIKNAHFIRAFEYVAQRKEMNQTQLATAIGSKTAYISVYRNGILFFIVIRVETIWLKMLSRIILIPVIAGISYEVLRLAGRSNSKIMDIISKPGMMMQGLTTLEPDEKMAEVAIAAVEAIFDWKGYLEENFPEKYPKGYFANAEAEK